MSLDASPDRRKQPQAAGTGNGNGLVSSTMHPYASNRLRLQPKEDHKSDSYEDLPLEFCPILFSTLERHLPPSILNEARDLKLQYMREILLRYSPEGERTRVHRHREYRQKIISNYQSLNRELYTLSAANFFVPSFLKAISENTEESFRRIMSEPSPGVYTFEMLQPRFCEMLLSEVENFERWVHETKFRIMRPNTMNKFGAVLDDFGLETMLDKLMIDFIRPISKVFFSEVGGATLDSHHGFVVEYGMDRDVELGFHVDDSEVTLNVCLSKQFSGGELFFRGIRCDKHVNTETQSEEIFDYFHVPGRAVLHGGRHRHGAKATTSGCRVNLLLWCRSRNDLLAAITGLRSKKNRCPKVPRDSLVSEPGSRLRVARILNAMHTMKEIEERLASLEEQVGPPIGNYHEISLQEMIQQLVETVKVLVMPNSTLIAGVLSEIEEIKTRMAGILSETEEVKTRLGGMESSIRSLEVEVTLIKRALFNVCND